MKVEKPLIKLVRGDSTLSLYLRDLGRYSKPPSKKVLREIQWAYYERLRFRLRFRLVKPPYFIGDCLLIEIEEVP